MRKYVTMLMVVTLLIVGCAREKEIKQQSLQGTNMIKTNRDGTAYSYKVNQSIAKQAVQHIKARKEVRDAVAVNTSKKLLVAYQVKHMHRFRMKQIKKDIEQQLKQLFPNHKIIVSSDLKIFWKTNELRDKINKDGMNEKQINKQIKKLKKLSEELT
ncbi:YhcN/YlaJ family sporulation lipoprotein [Thermaerobacillus caldiproteolyticus]|uniref:Uncharacterized protein YcfL n=1 Tax=Thermaerobacillus caldiproteolyticus TaxID=247480 RepID=A0A7V9Z6I8_9BACL|nr:YhcN/YlaJ family sporulation lipoprotein [Anoxybacillus caldiproteolyticus]MBA2874964.1 uncharacterized protein YcfL [Anoxybacillus caldiproteolyticus]QPA31762.1 YhcN/YlaJ family sporulation lipoprotein [Anoxybacillus caldiproteolyticus]